MKRVTINLNEETYQRVSEMAKAFEMTPSQLIRAMMNVGLQTGERLNNLLSRDFTKEIGA